MGTEHHERTVILPLHTTIHRCRSFRGLSFTRIHSTSIKIRPATTQKPYTHDLSERDRSEVRFALLFSCSYLILLTVQVTTPSNMSTLRFTKSPEALSYPSQSLPPTSSCTPAPPSSSSSAAVSSLWASSLASSSTACLHPQWGSHSVLEAV